MKDSRIRVRICPLCLSYSLRRGFVSPKGGAELRSVIEEVVRKAVNRGIDVQFYAEVCSIEYEPPRKLERRRIPVHVLLKHKEEDVRDSASLEIEMVPEKCPMCRRKERGVSEAIIQLRKEKGKVTESELNFIVSIIEKHASESGNPKAYIADIRRSGKGYDILLGDLKFAERVARAIKRNTGCKIKISRTISGIDDSGRPVMTASILLILPETPQRVV